MCGIGGYIGRGGPDTIKKMMRGISYRGPDKKHIYHNGDVWLGHNRLSIVGDKNNREMLHSEDRNIWLTCNGEIYNHRDLKGLLKKKHIFRTDIDTEIIIHLYEEYGTDCFSMLRGMFALALYDRNKDRMILARDKMGEKPLYWSIFNNTFIFASELKAITAHPEFSKNIDSRSLSQYLTYEYIPAPNTIFKGVKKLRPAHFLIYNEKGARETCYWEPLFAKRGQKGKKKITEEFNDLLKRSIEEKLDFSSNTGIFLSGGIDSGTIAYYAHQAAPSKIKTFSIGFQEKEFNETDHSSRLADHLGLKNRQKSLTAKDVSGRIDEIYSLLDEPLADMALIPGFFLSELAKEEVNVCLGGDGMDELMCGYDTFIAERLVPLYLRLPRPLRGNILKKIAKIIPSSQQRLSPDFKIKRFLKGVHLPLERRHHVWLGSFDPDQQEYLLTQKIKRSLGKDNNIWSTDKYWQKSGNDLDRVICGYLKTYLADDILCKLDRSSMYNSLETRSPFLDERIVDFVNSLDNNLKMKRFKTKYLLRETMKGKLPNSIIKKKKKGFGIPMSSWINNGLKDQINHTLSPQKIREQGIFEPKYVRNILEDHFRGKNNNYKLIWTLFVFARWYENYYEPL